jgi:hypothetical protein
VIAQVLRYAGFTADGQGGNPAGLVGTAALMRDTKCLTS